MVLKIQFAFKNLKFYTARFPWNTSSEISEMTRTNTYTNLHKKHQPNCQNCIFTQVGILQLKVTGCSSFCYKDGQFKLKDKGYLSQLSIKKKKTIFSLLFKWQKSLLLIPISIFLCCAGPIPMHSKNTHVWTFFFWTNRFDINICFCAQPEAVFFLLRHTIFLIMDTLHFLFKLKF